MILNKDELKELGLLIWECELAVGKEKADPRTYEKVFSIDDITKSLQGAHNPTYDVQKMLLLLQNKSNL